MTPRERVLAAIEHRPPDRVPVDLGSTPSSGISAIAYNKLKRHIGLTAGHTRIYDVVQQLAQPEDAVLDRFGIDVLDVGRAFNTSDDDWYDVTLADGGVRSIPKVVQAHPARRRVVRGRARRARDYAAAMPAGGTFFDQTCFPYVNGYPSNFGRLPEAMNKVLWSRWCTVHGTMPTSRTSGSNCAATRSS